MLDLSILASLREKHPGCALKVVYVDPEALTPEEAEDCPCVVIRRLRAPDWDKIDAIRESNEKLPKGAKQVSLDRAACTAADSGEGRKTFLAEVLKEQ